MANRPFHTRYEDLPEVLPIFPLTGALLLPDGRLPLNIFEPRYLAMVQDSLGAGRLIGMIQPSENGAESTDDEPALFEIGCAGRISSFEETDDGRLLITLTGVSRFRVARETDGLHGYRRVVPDWRSYQADLKPPPAFDLDRLHLLTALKAYCKIHQMEFNWKAVERAENHELIVSLCMACPFEPREKQAFLECEDPACRAETLIALMEMAVAVQQGGHGSLPQ